MERACRKSGGAVVAENDGSGAKREAGCRGARSGLNRPLTARSNLTYIVHYTNKAAQIIKAQ